MLHSCKIMCLCPKVRLDLAFSYNGLPEEPEESVGMFDVF